MDGFFGSRWWRCDGLQRNDRLVGGDAPGSGCSGGARFEAPWPGLIARPAFVCCGTCPPRGHSIASVARSAGLHPLRISLYARAAGSRDTFVVSVSHQYQYNTVASVLLSLSLMIGCSSAEAATASTTTRLLFVQIQLMCGVARINLLSVNASSDDPNQLNVF